MLSLLQTIKDVLKQLLTRARIEILGVWVVLLAIPLSVLGWAVGHIGPAADDWWMLEYVVHGQFLGWWCCQSNRPLHFMSYLAAYLINGPRFDGFYWFSFFLQGLSAVVFFEVLRRVLAPCVGKGAYFGALVGSLIFVLYPSYADRYAAIQMHDPLVNILALVGALLWIRAGETGQARYVLAGVVLMVANLLQKEGPTIVYGLYPAILLYYGQSPVSKRWRWLSLMWYAALAAYMVWRFVYVPRVDNTGLAAIYEPRAAMTIAGTLGYFLRGLVTITWDSFREAFVSAPQALHARGFDWFVPAALAAAAAVTGLGWLVSRRSEKSEPPTLDLRRWAYLAGFGLAVAVAGLAPYFAGNLAIVAVGPASRYSTIAMMGACFVVTLLALLPMYGLARLLPGGKGGENSPGLAVKWTGVAGTALTLALTAILAAGGMIRQYSNGYDVIDVWNVQRAFWQRVLDQGISFKPNTLILVNGLPRTIKGLQLAYFSQAYEPAFRLLFDDLPPGIRVFNSGPANGWHIVGDGIQSSLPSDPTVYPLQNVMVLYFDLSTEAVQVSPRLPAGLADRPVFVYTGTNPAQPPTRASAMAASLLGPPTQTSVCTTNVPIFTKDTAPADGDVMVAAYPSGEVLDYRAVASGSALSYAFRAPCGIWLRAYFQAHGTDASKQIVWLVSQYGSQTDYGTSKDAQSVVYDTSFGSGVTVDPAPLALH